MLPDLALSWTSIPFRCALSLFLTHPLRSAHIHTDTTPLLRQQVKQNNSLCHTIAPLPRSRHWLLYSMTFFPPSSLLFSLLLIGSVFFFHTIVTLLQQEPVMVNCLTFLIVRWCCAVWSVSTWFSPIHQERFVIVDTFVWWELEVLCVHWKPLYWHLSALDMLKFAATIHYANILEVSQLAQEESTLHKTQHWTGKKAFFKTQFYCTKCFIVFTKYI